MALPDNTDIEVANAAAAEAPDDAPFPEEEEPVDEPAPETPADPPPPAAIAHPPELIERAAVLLIPADEVAAMSSDELRRVIKHADRVGQMVFDSTKKPDAAPVAPPAPELAADDLAILDDPALVGPEVGKPIKAAILALRQELKARDERIAKLENKTGQSEAQVLHSRLMGVAAEVAPEVAKVFDISTQAGATKYRELLTIMGGIHAATKGLTEKQILQRAVKAMDIVPDKPKEEPKTAIPKKAWDDAALAAPLTRKAKDSAVDRVGKILDRYRTSKPVNGQPK